MWSLENSKQDESSKVRWELIPYMHGRCLDLGAGPWKVFPHFVSVDSGKDTALFGVRMQPDIRCDATRLDLFADESCDLSYSSHLLEHIPYKDVPATLKEWFRVTKKGGHVILYLPADDAYPHIGEAGANPDHQWEPNYDNVVAALEQVEHDWDIVDFQHRTEDNEYSIFFVIARL